MANVQINRLVLDGADLTPDQGERLARLVAQELRALRWDGSRQIGTLSLSVAAGEASDGLEELARRIAVALRQQVG